MPKIIYPFMSLFIQCSRKFIAIFKHLLVLLPEELQPLDPDPEDPEPDPEEPVPDDPEPEAAEPVPERESSCKSRSSRSLEVDMAS